MKVVPFLGRPRHSKLPAEIQISSLYDRIQAVRDPKASISPLLNQWIEEGQTVSKPQLQSLVRIMKDFRRFHHALEISQWMTDRRYFTLTPSDAAIRLDLISMVHGREQAESNFNNIPNNLKTSSAYGALLSGYVREKSVEKAEATMQKMREMDFATSSFPYNMLINLYSQTGNHGKIEALIQEMQRKAIPCDAFTVSNLMVAYVAASDISAMEKFLNRMEEDPHISVDWNIYSVAASGYLKVGLIDKALEMLKKIESNRPHLERFSAFKYLLSLYARTSHKQELYRVWNLYKPSYECPEAYSCMITCLTKLDDIEGAEKIFQEWECECTMYDFRVLNRLLSAYCKRCLFDKAESLVNKVIEERMPYASTWNILAKGYVEDKQMPKAVEMLKKAISVGRKGWRPNSIILDACIEYLEGQGNLEEIEEIARLCKNSGIPDGDIHHRLLRTSAAGEKSVSAISS